MIRRTVVETGPLFSASILRTPSQYTEASCMSLPFESRRPRAIGINIGSFTGWPGVGGTSWLQNIKHILRNHNGTA